MAGTCATKAAAVLALAANSTVKLNNGVEMPLVSFGPNMYDPGMCRSATSYALQAGIRSIWSSYTLGDHCQEQQYQAIKESGVPRSEILLTGTVDTHWCSDEEECYTATKDRAKKQFEVFGQNGLDILMLDYPGAGGCPAITGQWKALQEFYAAGKVRAIAVSNFDLEQLKCAAAAGRKPVVPAINQVRFNADMLAPGLVAEHRKLGVLLQAFSPLNSGGLVADPVLKKIGKQHKKSAAQVALRWIVWQGAGANVGSTNLKHLKENANIFDFELLLEEVYEIGNRTKTA